MITDAIVSALAAVFGFIGSLLPSDEPPAWLTDTLPGEIEALGAQFGQLGQWVPMDAIGMAGAAVVTAFAVAWGVRLVRIALSLFTGGGGGAA